MSNLLIRFVYRLKRHDLGTTFRERHGPHFARWLPDGIDDGLIREFGEDASLRVWFERYGSVDDTFIEFTTDKKEVDSDVMRRQLGLDAGPLFGEVMLKDISSETVAVLKEDARGQTKYEGLGRIVVKKIIQPGVDDLLSILRYNFGQYWIRPLEEWDSRDRSLGQYCYLHGMKWKTESGDAWTDFIPNERETAPVEVEGRLNREVKILTEEDWKNLERIWASDYQPSFGAELLMKAHEQLRTGDLKYALLEGVTALEVAIEEYADRALYVDESLEPGVNAFLQNLQKPKNQISVLIGSADLVPPATATETIAAIELRHEVIHEGAKVEADQENLIWSLLETVASLLLGPTFRFSSGMTGQALLTEESWEDIPEPEMDLQAIGLGPNNTENT